MSKFKYRDKVVAIDDVLRIKKGREYTVMSIDGDCMMLFECAGIYYANQFELVDKPFAKPDLEVGMLIELNNGYVGNVLSDYVLDTMIKHEDVVAIYKPTETGFERVWTKPEPKLYTLELPNNTKKQRYYGVHTELDGHYRFGKMVTNGTFKTQFTQEEIENLPYQDLIKVLVKKEIV